jgi:hypothetical protein
MNMNIQSKLREIQDEASNRNWRINFISHAEENKPIVNGIDTPAGAISLIGIFLFLGGFGYIMVKRGSVPDFTTPLSLCVVGFLMAFSGSMLNKKIKKKEWIAVESTCIDHETKLGRTAQNAHIWALRALCEFEINGEKIQCTPEITWSERKGEGWKRQFIRKDDQGITTCTLLINPSNPREVQFHCN